MVILDWINIYLTAFYFFYGSVEVVRNFRQQVWLSSTSNRYFENRFDIVNVHLRKKPQWFLEKSPLSKVPLLEREDGTVVSESTITVAYLEKAYPEPAILPSDAWEEAQHKFLAEVLKTKVSS